MLWKKGQNEAEHSTWMLLLTGKTSGTLALNHGGTGT